MCVFDFRSIAKLITVLIDSSRFFEVEIDRLKTQVCQSVEFTSLGDTVMIRVLPKSQTGEDRVLLVNHAVSVTTIC